MTIKRYIFSIAIVAAALVAMTALASAPSQAADQQGDVRIAINNETAHTVFFKGSENKYGSISGTQPHNINPFEGSVLRARGFAPFHGSEGYLTYTIGHGGPLLEIYYDNSLHSGSKDSHCIIYGQAREPRPLRCELTPQWHKDGFKFLNLGIRILQ